ncbi:MAG: redoxin domain-containing protein [Candidatus Dormibacterales bacterium]
MPRFRGGLGALAAAGAAASLASCSLPGQPTPTGTLLVVVSSAAPGRAVLRGIAVHSASGWRALGSYAGLVPAAPADATAATATVPAGSYDALRVGKAELPVGLQVTAGQVEPVLVGVGAGRPLPHGAYGGTAQVNLGLQELSGRLPALPGLQIQDQDGRPLDTAGLAGRVTLLASFTTRSHEAGALMTGLLLDLRPRLGRAVRILEVTSDPAHDGPPQLSAYARRLGVGWTLATGGLAAITTLLNSVGLERGLGDTSASGLAVVDTHGYAVKVFSGTPDPGPALAPAVSAYLSQAGRTDLRDHGSGWGAPQVLDEVRSMAPPGLPPSGVAGRAPSFEVRGWDGRSYGLGSFGGRPLVINFWASWCVPCQTEMPMLQRAAARNPRVAFLFVDEADDPGSARRFLSGLGVPVSGPVASDPDGSLAEKFRLVAFPTTVFVRADGSVEGVHPGQLDQATLSDFLAGLGG